MLQLRNLRLTGTCFLTLMNTGSPGGPCPLQMPPSGCRLERWWHLGAGPGTKLLGATLEAQWHAQGHVQALAEQRFRPRGLTPQQPSATTPGGLFLPGRSGERHRQCLLCEILTSVCFHRASRPVTAPCHSLSVLSSYPTECFQEGL